MAWKGIKFPVKVDERSVIGGETDEALILDDIKQLLNTAKGERVRRPEFGTRLRQFLHEPRTAPVLAMIRMEILDALRDWEPRITVKDVTASAIPDSQAVAVTIRYTLRETGTERTYDLTLSA